MEPKRKIIVPWDPALVEPALRGLVGEVFFEDSGREGLSSSQEELLGRVFSQASRSRSTAAGRHWSQFWYAMHALFPHRVPWTPAWIPTAPTDDFVKLLSECLRRGIVDGIRAFAERLPESYRVVRMELAEAECAILASSFELSKFNVDSDFLENVLRLAGARRFYASRELEDSRRASSISAEARSVALSSACRRLVEELPEVEFVPLSPLPYVEEMYPGWHSRVQSMYPETALVASVEDAGEELSTYTASIEGASATALRAIIKSDALALATRYEAALELASRGPTETLALCDYLIEVLRDATISDPWTHACVGLAEEVQLTNPDRRQALAVGLLRIATELYPTPQREVAWVALLRWTSLVPVPELAALSRFLAPGTEVETMQCAAQCLWNRLALEPSPPSLPALEARCAALLSKCIDIDWLGLPFAASLTANLLLAYATVASDAELARVITRARELDPDHFPWQLVRSKTRRMQEHVHAHALPSVCVDRLHALLP